MKSLRILAAGLLLLLSWDAWGKAVEVKGVRIWPAPDNTRLVFETSGRVEHRLFMLSDPDRLVIDIKNAQLHKPGVLSASGSLLGGIRSAPHEGDLRIVLDLKHKVQPKSFTLPPSQGYSDRLVIDLFPEGADEVSALATAAAQPTDTGERPAAEKRPQELAAAGKSAEKPEKAENDARAKESERARAEKEPARAERSVAEQRVTLIPPGKPVKTVGHGRDLIVAIDAGHGGEDPGAIGLRGTEEKNVVLAIARRLKALVEHEPGMRPFMIRDGDYFVSLGGRVEKARRAHADLFVSIHADSFINHEARGSSVYMLSDRGASSAQARLLAQHENESDRVGGVSLDDKDDLLKSVLVDLSQTATKEASTDVAQRVLGSLGERGELHRGHVERAGFRVLKAPDIPSILVETAFISNREEEEKLKSAGFQETIAKSILQGLRAHFRRYAPPGTLIAQQALENRGRGLPVAEKTAAREEHDSRTQVAETNDPFIERPGTFNSFAR